MGNFEAWRDAFQQVVQELDIAAPLKAASLAEDLKAWTECLTAAVVRSCQAMSWPAAAKGHPGRRLPVSRQEYLGIDVMAFLPPGKSGSRWPRPQAAYELENSVRDDDVLYSLWKVLCVRADLRVLVAYRPDWEQGRKLVATACDDVIGSFSVADRSAIGGETALIIGNRGEGETFPWGYFKCWLLDANIGRFEKV